MRSPPGKAARGGRRQRSASTSPALLDLWVNERCRSLLNEGAEVTGVGAATNGEELQLRVALFQSHERWHEVIRRIEGVGAGEVFVQVADAVAVGVIVGIDAGQRSAVNRDQGLLPRRSESPE